MSNIAIKTENVSKYYRLGQINNGSLKKDIQTWVALKTGKVDPNSKIGENRYNGTDGFWALKDINFEIHQGDRVGIIGKNGAGKSTLLKVLSEVTAPTTGHIKIKGRVASLLEVGTGFHPEMTGRENIYLNGAILGMKRSEINDKMKQIIEFSELEQHIDTPVKRYSSGMYVRLAFAVAAHLDSEILIADEVLAVGDATFQKKALGKMSELSTAEGRTVLFVSHQMNAVKALCKTGIVLDKGKVVFSDEIDNCVSYYQKDLFSVEQSGDLDSYNNDFFNLLEFEVVDEQGNIVEGAIENDKKAFVRICVDMKKLHTAFTIGYAIYDKEGNVVYWSNNTDIYDEKKQLHKGRNCLKAEIPSHFLNEDDYYVYLMASIHFQEWLIDPSKDSPRRKLSIQGGLSESPFWTLKRPGICAPVLNWYMEE